MRQGTQVNKPLKLNMDKSPKSLAADEAFYLLNHERYLNTDGSKKESGSLGKTTPLPANYALCDIEKPLGENYTIGTYYSDITGEEYSWNLNTNNVHYIQRVSAENGCEIVYHNDTDNCLVLSAEPSHAIEQWRAYLKVDRTCKNRAGKSLIWIDGSDTPIGQLDVEASIATKNFTTPFFDLCREPCAFIQMTVPKPCDCIKADYIPLPVSDHGLTNSMLDIGFKFIFRHVYYDLRASEWSDPSSLYYQDTKQCFGSATGFPRCMKLSIPIGNPLVDKIEIAISKDNGLTWTLYDTVDKYNPYVSPTQQWYERELSPAVSSTLHNECYFNYIFCNEKQCTALDQIEVTRDHNPIPRGPQALLTIKNNLGFLNYKKGNCPLNKLDVNKFEIKLDCDSENNCIQEYANVTVRAIIHNSAHDRNQFIYREGSGGTDDLGDTAWFGGLNPALDGGYESGYDQNFRDRTRNFIAYIEGTEYFGEMKQWKCDPNFINLQEHGIVSNMGDRETRNKLRRDARDGKFFYQEYIFRVPKGTKGYIRLCSHHATGLQPDTSTFVKGLIPNIHGYVGYIEISDIIDESREEIFFDSCSGDTVAEEVFIIQDNAVDSGLSKKASAYYGYIKDVNGRPVEGVHVTDPAGYGHTRCITDFNGFYHFYLNGGSDTSMPFKIIGERDCGNFAPIKSFEIQGQSGFNTESNQTILDTDLATYKSNFYANVQTQVLDCNGVGIGGLTLALSGSKVAITDAQGFAKWKIRNYVYRARVVRAVVMDAHACFATDCDNKCNPCLPTTAGATPACYDGIQGTPIVLSTMIMNREAAFFQKTGLKSGGRYGFGIVAEGDDRISAVNELVELSMPRTQDKGKLSFCGFMFDNKDIVWPNWIKCLKIVRTENLDPYVLQWVVDKIDRSISGKIKLTIQSLNDYNAAYNFKTNTIYQYLKGDRVEFIRNGDGKIYQTASGGLLNFLTLSPFHDKIVSGLTTSDVNYFNQLLIEDDSRLDDLKEGALIEIRRPFECKGQPVYYTICVTIPIVDGIPEIPKGTFHTFDTFLVNRTIGKNPSQPFEHRNPSDFWGEGLDDKGRAHFVNKYEDEKRYGRNISLNSATQFNSFGFLEKTFDAPEQGDIMAATISDGRLLLAICQNDAFIAEVADDLLKVGSDGTVRTISKDDIIGQPQTRLTGRLGLVGRFGCDYDSIGSIYFGDGYATWWDVKNGAYVKHDYSNAKDVSIDVCQSYISRKSIDIQKVNKDALPIDKMRLATGMNRLTGAIYTTVKSLRHAAIDNSYEPYVNPNNTIVYHPASGDWLGFSSDTPDRYGRLDLFDDGGCAYLTYFHGVPYVFPRIASKWNEFYGIAVDRVVGVAVNEMPDKLKKGLAIEVQDEKMWFAYKVTTDQPDFDSEIPPIRWNKSGRKWNASFLSNKNSRSGLYGEVNTQGYAICITFVRDNTDALQYRTLNDAKRIEYDELDYILFKYQIIEQSGFTTKK